MNIFGNKSKSSQKDSTKESAAEKPAQTLETIENSIGMKLVKIPAGKFTMGSPVREIGRMPGERQHEVTIEKPFYIGAYEVTQGQYKEVMNGITKSSPDDNQPISGMAWQDAMTFCRTLGQQENQTYRLPTEEEWEYACRAGRSTPFGHGAWLTSVEANFDSNFPYGVNVKALRVGTTKPVGSYKPNSWGLYDMHGNVYEWCLDMLEFSGNEHIVRGGCGSVGGAWCRSAQRWKLDRAWGWVGLRVVRTVEPEEGEFDIPIARPLDRDDNDTAKRNYSTADLIAKIDEAFAKPAPELAPPVVIFPVVDAQHKVRKDGAGLSYLAQYHAAYIPAHRMDVALEQVVAAMQNATCVKPGVQLDDASLEICLASIGAERFVLPQLTEENGKLSLTWQLRLRSELKPQLPEIKVSDSAAQRGSDTERQSHDSTPAEGETDAPVAAPKPAGSNEAQAASSPRESQGAKPKNVTQQAAAAGPQHHETATQLADVPGLIAKGVLSDLGVKLNDAEVKYITTPQFPSANQIARLSQIIATRKFGKVNSDDIQFLKRNRRCVPLYVLLMYQVDPDHFAYYEHLVSFKDVNSEDLTIIQLSRSASIRNSLVKMLDFAPSRHSDSTYMRLLALKCSNLSIPALTEHLLAVWQKLDGSYAGYNARGDFEMSWAQQADRNLAPELQQEGLRRFETRIEKAQRDLEKALEINPLGFEAHTRLITLGMIAGFPDEYSAEHFDRAVALRPSYKDAYAVRARGIMARWGGDRETILAFARRCFESPYTLEEKIPDYGHVAIEELSRVPAQNAFTQPYYQDPDVWETLKLYYENGKKSGQTEFASFTRQYFAKLGAYGEHYDDVADIYDQLDKGTAIDYSIWDRSEYLFLRDLVRSQTAKGTEKVKTSLRIALALGNFDEAAQWVSKLNDGTDESIKLAKKARQAIDLGRKLADQRRLELKPADIVQYFEGIDDKWQVKGDRLVGNLPKGYISALVLPFGVANVEVTAKLGWQASNANISVNVHTRALRSTAAICYSLPGTIYLQHNGLTINAAYSSEQEQICRIRLTNNGIDLQPAKDLQWNAPVFDAAPAEIAIGFDTRSSLSTVWIESITLEQLDEPNPAAENNFK